MKRGRMTPNERRQIELVLLCQRRDDTCDHLANEFGVSRATICDDIMIKRGILGEWSGQLSQLPPPSVGIAPPHHGGLTYSRAGGEQ